MEKRWTLSLGVLLLSIATLTIEVMQLRVFSVTLWHHLTYMIITVAMLGLGASGSYVAIKGVGDEQQARKWAGKSIWGFVASTIIGFAIVLRIPLDTFMVSSSIQLSFIFIYYLFLLPPFFFAGMAITVLMTHYVRMVHRLYFWNLLGSAIGSTLFLWLLVTVGGDYSLLLIISLAALSGTLIFLERGQRITSGIIALVCLLLIPATPYIFPIHAAPSKALGLFEKQMPNLETISVEWNPTGRIDVVTDPKIREYSIDGVHVDKIFTIDGDAYTFAYDVDKPWGTVPAILKTLYSTAYHFKDKPKAAMIGLGGGVDILTALHAGAREITAVEINSAMINAAMKHYNSFKYNPYTEPRVSVIHEEGRAFMRRSPEKYDIIQMSGVDTWTALTSGAYVLSENYIYTTQAFEEYFEHLEDDGILSMIRWVFKPPRETLRLCSQGMQMLRNKGKTTKPENHFIVLQQNFLASFLLKKTAWTRKEVQKLQEMAKDWDDAKILYAPGLDGNNAFYRYFKAVSDGKEKEFLTHYPYNIEPVSDDKPFFFKFYRWDDIFKFNTGTGGYIDAITPVGFIILVASLIQALFLGCLMILYPLWRFKKQGLKIDGAGKMIAYFTALGLGFMFVEVAMMQKFVLFLGHPSYSVSILLAGLLFFSGIGSFIAGKFKFDPRKIILVSTATVSIMTVGYVFLLPAVFDALIGAPHMIRIIVTLLLIAPIGTMMGMPFPTGLSHIQKGSLSFVPWAFGVNGIAGVIASVLSILLAMAFGFNFVFFLAAAIYLAGGAVMYSLVIKE